MATSAVAGVGSAAWLGVSSSWGARFLRQRFEEIGRDIPPAPHKPTLATWSDNAVTLAWLGHATVLINFYGVRILTDPVLYPRIGVDLGLGTQRVHAAEELEGALVDDVAAAGQREGDLEILLDE